METLSIDWNLAGDEYKILCGEQQGTINQAEAKVNGFNPDENPAQLRTSSALGRRSIGSTVC
jgi:hypothetical protein